MVICYRIYATHRLVTSLSSTTTSPRWITRESRPSSRASNSFPRRSSRHPDSTAILPLPGRPLQLVGIRQHLRRDPVHVATGTARARPGAPRRRSGPRYRGAATAGPREVDPPARQGRPAPSPGRPSTTRPRFSTPALARDAAPLVRGLAAGDRRALRRPARGGAGRPGASPPPPATRSGHGAPPGGDGPGPPTP